MPAGAVRVRLFKGTSIEAAQRLSEEAGGAAPLVLDFASDSNAGGGCRSNQRGTQEESLCRQTSLLPSLERLTYPIPRFGVAYAPDICVIREEESDGYALRAQPFWINVVAAALPNCGGELDGKQRNFVAQKIRSVLNLAAKHRHTRLVLGAWGCGAFGNAAEDVAQIFRAELSNASGLDVIFAVTGRNFEAFHRVLQGEVIPNKAFDESAGVRASISLEEYDQETYEDVDHLPAPPTLERGDSSKFGAGASAYTKEEIRQWVALGKEAKSASTRAAGEEDLTRKRTELQDAVAKYQAAAALRPDYSYPGLARALAELSDLEPALADIKATLADDEELHLPSADHSNDDDVAVHDDKGCDLARSQQPQKSGKASKHEKEQERLKKDVAKRAPKFIMMVGLPGAGKSTFSSALEASGGWVRANQDDLGRKDCEKLVSKTVPDVRKGKVRLVVDRCNVTCAERREWLDNLGQPAKKDVVCVFFDVSSEDCKRRAAGRTNHPTIREGGGARIIDEIARKLEVPTEKEGFSAVVVVRTHEEVDTLLRRYGVEKHDSGNPPAQNSQLAEVQALVQAPEQAVKVSTPPEGAGTEFDLPPAFATWLRQSLATELEAADAEGMFTAAEVILANSKELSSAVVEVQEIFRSQDALQTADELQEQWRLACTS